MIYQKDEVIVREGEMTTDFFVLMKGRIGVYKEDVLIAEYSEPGIIIGEMSAILGRSRTATMKALELTGMATLPGNVDEMISEQPEIAKSVMINLARNLQKMTNDYWAIANNKEREIAKDNILGQGGVII